MEFGDRIHGPLMTIGVNDRERFLQRRPGESTVLAVWTRPELGFACVINGLRFE